MAERTEELRRTHGFLAATLEAWHESSFKRGVRPSHDTNDDARFETSRDSVEVIAQRIAAAVVNE